MSAATVLTSAMGGMPVLSGSGGSLATLFRYIAPILGWSIEFDSGTDIIVIKPQSYVGGQALLYMIDDRSGRGGYAPRVAEIKAYESMSDINTGAGLVGPVYIHKSRTADTVTRPYAVLGDAFGFHMFGDVCGQYPSDMVTRTYMGFCHNFTDHSGVCGLFGHTDAYGPFGQGDFLRQPTTSASAGCYMHKDESGTLNRNVAVYLNSCKQPYETISAGYSTAMSVWNDGDMLYMGQQVIGDGTAASAYCYFPGLYYPLHKAGQGGLSTKNKAIGNYRYFTVYGNNIGIANIGGVLIDTENFRP